MIVINNFEAPKNCIKNIGYTEQIRGITIDSEVI